MSDKSEQIIKAAIELFSQEGVGVRTAKISENAGIAEGTLFRYFKTKQDLIDAVFLEIKKDLAEALLTDIPASMSAQELLKHIWNTCIHWAMKNPCEYEALQILESSKKLSEDALKKQDEMFNYVKKNFKAGIGKKEILDTPVEVLYAAIGGQLQSVAAYAMKKKLKGKKLQDLIDTGFRINWQGLKK